MTHQSEKPTLILGGTGKTGRRLAERLTDGVATATGIWGDEK